MTMDDEFEKIDWLTKRLSRSRMDASSVDVRLGIGDDAAIIDFGERPAVVTVDTQVEGVHFRRSLLSDAALGTRALIAAASDVWAMGARPGAAVVAMTLPAGYEDSAFRDLIEGIDEGARELGVQVIGGNLSGGPTLSITTTVLGPSPDRVLTRAGAEVGNRIFVTGTLGAAALGLAVLERAATHENSAAFAKRWRRPPSHGTGLSALTAGATAAIDVSDGFMQDLAHVCTASGVGAEVHAPTLPVAEGYHATCKALGLDPTELALTGGEDYEILFTAPEASIPDGVATAVGHVTEPSGIHVLDADGSAITLSGGGYRHFS